MERPELTAEDEAALPSATVILLRDSATGPEVLLLQRNPELRSMGGVWVFPGGKVDADDPGGDIESQARHAAVRELHEEAGIHLPEAQLTAFSHWLTPVVVKRRFATWFYIATLSADHNGDQSVTVDGSEIVAHQWIRPFDAIEAERRGELSLPPPTIVTLMDISSCEDSAAAIVLAESRQPPYFFPRIVQQEEDLFFLYPGDAGYDAMDPAVEGPRHRSERRGGQFSYQRDIAWLPREAG